MPKTKQEKSSGEKSLERWFGMRLTPAQKAKIERLAACKGGTQKDAVLEEVSGGPRRLLTREPPDTAALWEEARRLRSQ